MNKCYYGTTKAKGSILFEYKQIPKNHGIVSNKRVAIFFLEVGYVKLGRNICEHNKDYKEMVSRHYKEISHTLIRQLKHITTFSPYYSISSSISHYTSIVIVLFIIFKRVLYFCSSISLYRWKSHTKYLLRFPAALRYCPNH